MTKRGSCLLPAVLSLVLAATASAGETPPLSDGTAAAQDPEIVTLLGLGWQFFESADLRQAEDSFSKAMARPRGRSVAEVHFALAAVWWERGNAMASYQRLLDARRVSSTDFEWDAGPGGDWDLRIAARIEFIERNFTVVRLKLLSGRGVVPPLADPAPADPLLARVADGVPRVLEEALEAGARNVWLLLPNGTWWVGDDLLDLDGGEMDATRARTWLLPADTGRAGRLYRARRDAISRGASLAAARKRHGAAAGGQVAGPDEPHFVVEVGGGGVSVAAQNSDAGPGVFLAGHAGFGVSLPLGRRAPALTVAFSVADLPVSRCSLRQERSTVVSFDLGLGLAHQVGSRLWLAGHAGVRFGGGIANGGADAREACAQARRAAEPGALSYGVRLSDGEQSGVVSYADLGWLGTSFAFGPEADMGVLVATGRGHTMFGLSFFARHDQLFAILDGDHPTRWFLDEESGAPASADLGTLSSAASMARFQFGLRGRYLF